MDIKKMILEIVNTEQNNIRYSAIAIEKLVNTVVSNYITKQGKEVFVNYPTQNKARFREYDIYAPDGLDDYVGSTVFELKMVRYRKNYRSYVNAIAERFSVPGEQFENLIIILVGETSDIIDPKIYKNSTMSYKNLSLAS